MGTLRFVLKRHIYKLDPSGKFSEETAKPEHSAFSRIKNIRYCLNTLSMDPCEEMAVIPSKEKCSWPLCITYLFAALYLRR